MGVLTTKSMAAKAQATKEAGGEKSSSVSRRVVWCVRFPNAPQGKCNASFHLDGKSKMVELEDGLYKFKSIKERKSMLNDMVKAGFVVADYHEGEAPEVEQKDDKKFVIRYGHPDNTPDKKKSGNVSFKIGSGKKAEDIVLELDDHGTVTTDNTEIQKTLEKMKWEEVGRYEIPEDENGEDQQS